VTFPARIGDCLFALAAIKAFSEHRGYKVDMAVGDYLAPLVPLLKAQDYINDAWSERDWKIQFSAPAGPRVFRKADYTQYDTILDMGMDGWPQGTILEDCVKRAGVGVEPWHPWLKPLTQVSSHVDRHSSIGICFSDEWCELKAGIILALLKSFPEHKFVLLTHPEARLAREFTFPFRNIQTVYTSINGLSDWLIGCKLVVCCKSAPRAMARGLGLKTAVIEPSIPRHNPVFDMPNENLALEQVLNDFDARACVELVRRML